jgi:N-acetylated-alpha-linked acidic dipeptidase
MTPRRLAPLLLFAAACAAPEAAESRPADAAASRPAAADAALVPEAPTVAAVLARAYDHIAATVSSKEIEGVLKALTARPHVAGSFGGRESAKYVEGRFMLAGLETRIEEFEVLLPYPEQVEVELLRPYAYRAPLAEVPTDRDYDTHVSDALPPYMAYAADGDVSGGLVYANYGRAEDFDRLASLGVDVRGRIAIVRYGKTYRGSKVLEAARRGALAVVLYSDPADDGFTKGPEYPDGPWRPKTAVQRGSVLDIARRPGDPLTPGEASTPQALRLDLADAETLPPIPAVALSWGDAEPMLRTLDGPPAPEGFQGGLPFAYRLGGGKATAARVALRSDWKSRKIQNVIGVLRGSIWPEEEIVVGGHRDAWVRGAVDPCGGQAALIEAARILGEFAKRGVRPSRSIVFCSWDGEEFGLLGSTEHVEDRRTRLIESCHLYLNADASVSGPKFSIGGAPELRNLARAALGALADDRSDRGVAERPDLWRTTSASGGAQFAPPGGGSDHVAFVALVGAPTLSVDSSGPYGVYHSSFDTFGWMKRFGDPDFSAHARVARAIAALVFTASTASVPDLDFGFSARRYAAEADTLGSLKGAPDVAALKAAFGAAARAGEEFSSARAAALATDPDPLKLTTANKRTLYAQRAFLADKPLKSRPFYRNRLVAVDPENGYGPYVFPAVREALAAGDAAAASEEVRRLVAAADEWRRRIEVAAALLRAVAVGARPVKGS